ncbi:MAG: LysE family translocator [Hyphomicrobiales bacterium]|nr:LysE family translocator [Hyphomicrobiales bacterium]
MNFAALPVFFAVYLLALASPGPGNAAVIARALRGGFAQTAPFIAGIYFGDLIWMALAAFGLAALAERFAEVFMLVRIAGALYLLYLAFRLWTAPAEIHVEGVARETPLRSLLGGLSLTLGNPKAMAFFVAIAPGLIDAGHASATQFLILAGVMAFGVALAMGAYAAIAARAGAFVTRPAQLRFMNRAAACGMAGAAVAILARK